MEERQLYPVNYNGRDWYEEDCDEMFNAVYTDRVIFSRFAGLPGDTFDSSLGVCIGEGVWITPDGVMREN